MISLDQFILFFMLLSLLVSVSVVIYLITGIIKGPSLLRKKSSLKLKDNGPNLCNYEPITIYHYAKDLMPGECNV